jgi:pimeloyl-ACP methyl ester carboxylesterase
MSIASAAENRIDATADDRSTTTAVVRSEDGTVIAFERIGRGPVLILVDGALCYRGFGPSSGLARLLADHFTVFTYDRRWRGESGDIAPYAVDREIEDLNALIKEAGASAFVWGVSSGAALALEAANRLSGIKKLALYEPPFIVDKSRRPISRNDWDRIKEAVAAGRRGEAVKRFLTLVGVPRLLIALMPLLPAWSKLKAVAHTLPYDGAIVAEHQTGKSLSVDRWSSALVPTLVMDGGKSPAWIRNAAHALAAVLPNAQHRTLEGQTHMVKPKAHTRVLAEFFKE